MYLVSQHMLIADIVQVLSILLIGNFSIRIYYLIFLLCIEILPINNQEGERERKPKTACKCIIKIKIVCLLPKMSSQWRLLLVIIIIKRCALDITFFLPHSPLSKFTLYTWIMKIVFCEFACRNVVCTKFYWACNYFSNINTNFLLIYTRMIKGFYNMYKIVHFICMCIGYTHIHVSVKQNHTIIRKFIGKHNASYIY